MGFKAVTGGIIEAAVAQNATATGAWIPVSVGDGFSFWFYMTATGAPSVTLYVDYSPFPVITNPTGATTGWPLLSAASTTRTNYLTATLASAVTTKATLLRYSCPTALTEPVQSIRLRATEGNVAAVTTLTFVGCYGAARPI